jgi:hypothetical protein
MDLEREEQRHRYRLCRAGFGLIALGLILLGVDGALNLALMVTPHHNVLLSLLTNPWWGWLVGAPITWTTVIGSYLLWGRSTDPAWQRRAGLLVMMNGIDLMVWTLYHGDELGLQIGKVGHDWLFLQVTRGLGWAEFLLFTSLAVDMLTQLRKKPSPETGLAARSLATIGLVMWAILFVAQTNWAKGWPLVPQKIPGEMGILIYFATCLLTTIASIQVAALTGSAFVECGRALAEMNQEDMSDDLLRSRSETSADNPDRWFHNDHDPWR